jgi:hypothetical protein
LHPPGPWCQNVSMLAIVRIGTVLAVMVLLNLIGLTIAAFLIFRRK